MKERGRREEEEVGRGGRGGRGPLQEGPISKSALFKVDAWCMRCQSTTMSNSIFICSHGFGALVPK